MAANLHTIAKLGVPSDLMSELAQQIEPVLPGLADPDRAVNNLERFFSASRNPLSLAALFERDKTGLPILLKIFSTSQYLSDILVADPESYDGLRISAGQPFSKQVLVRELRDEVRKARNATTAMAILRRFKRRETLRIAYGDIIALQDLQTVTTQISYIADVVCQAALNFAELSLADRFSWPTIDGRRCRFVVIALGKLGGNELNYSSDIDLILVYEADGDSVVNKSGETKRIRNAEYFQLIGKEMVRLISETTVLGSAYRVDLRLRPHGRQGSLAVTADSLLAYYDMHGRTWERQALIKARPAAGNQKFGQHLLDQLRTWIYPVRLTRTSISGIKSLRRRMERKTAQSANQQDVKTGAGGIRDIEFVVQFLQLLHGRYHPELQTAGTLDTLTRLQEVGLLNNQEFRILDHNYRWLRRVEHRLQIMFDLQTHQLPGDEKELNRVAIRMGYSGNQALEKFLSTFKKITRQNREILEHHLHHAFPENEVKSERRTTEFDELDLVLDPSPETEWIESTLSRYGFSDPQSAYTQLDALAREDQVFLPPARCRHFFAGIARELLIEVAKTPVPQQTLVTLNRVSQNLGGKAVLWELFSKNRPIMTLFVKMCAACPYLCDILASHPGMIDGLLDSLLLQRLPDRKILRQTIESLVVGAEEIDLIIHAFKDAAHLRVGVRDVGGRDAVTKTQAALSDIAEVCLQTIVRFEFASLAERFGQPMYDHEGANVPCEFVVLAMGKLGGREPNYHSDLDVMFLFESDGTTLHDDHSKQTSNQEFFERLSAAITKRMTSIGPYGKLYELDSRLRPTGKSGTLATSFNEFERYFTAHNEAESRGAQLWERQALCKARPITGSSQVRRAVRKLVYSAITAVPWKPSMAKEIHEMRLRWQEGASGNNLKRGAGGTVDIEFAVQTLQLKHATTYPQVLIPGTLPAIQQLRDNKLLDEETADLFSEVYETYRHIEARIRLMDLPSRHDLPDDTLDSPLQKLAYLLDYHPTEQLVNKVNSMRKLIRQRFDQLMDEIASDDGH